MCVAGSSRSSKFNMHKIPDSRFPWILHHLSGTVEQLQDKHKWRIQSIFDGGERSQFKNSSNCFLSKGIATCQQTSVLQLYINFSILRGQRQNEKERRQWNSELLSRNNSTNLFQVNFEPTFLCVSRLKFVATRAPIVDPTICLSPYASVPLTPIPSPESSSSFLVSGQGLNQIEFSQSTSIARLAGLLPLKTCVPAMCSKGWCPLVFLLLVVPKPMGECEKQVMWKMEPGSLPHVLGTLFVLSGLHFESNFVGGQGRLTSNSICYVQYTRHLNDSLTERKLVFDPLWEAS